MLRVNALTGFGGGRRVTSVSFVASAVSNANTITIPAGAQAGDFAILFDHAYNAGVSPSAVVPTDWTSWAAATSLDAGADAATGQISYKILVTGDPGTAITGMNDTSEDKVMFVFRGNTTITTVTAAGKQTLMSAANPASITTTASAGVAPLVVCGVAACVSSTAAFVTESPAFDATVATADADMIAGYKIYNTAPADHTIDMNDLGAINWQAATYVEIR